MKTLLAFLFILSISSSGFAQVDCNDSDHTVYAKTVTEGIKLAKETIPSGYVDNSICTSPIIDCDNGFNISEDAQHCVDKSRDLQGEVSVKIAIRRNLN